MKLSPQTVVPSALLTAILALLTATFPGTATAATVITGGTEGTSSTSRYGGGFTHATDFTSTTAQQINALGFWDSGANGLGTGFSYTVGLWETSSQTLLESVTISNADALDPSLTVAGGQWRYETIPTVSLTSGKTYTMGFYTPLDMSPDDSLFLDSTVTTASTVSIINQFDFLASTVLTFPTNFFPSVDHYYTQVNAKFVPEPGSAGLVTLGCLMLLGRRRKTKD